MPMGCWIRQEDYNIAIRRGISRSRRTLVIKKGGHPRPIIFRNRREKDEKKQQYGRQMSEEKCMRQPRSRAQASRLLDTVRGREVYAATKVTHMPLDARHCSTPSEEEKCMQQLNVAHMPLDSLTVRAQRAEMST